MASHFFRYECCIDINKLALVLSLSALLPALCPSVAISEQLRNPEGVVGQQQLFANWKTLDAWDQTERSYEVEVTSVRPQRTVNVSNVTRTRQDCRLEINQFPEAITVFGRSPAYSFLIGERSRGAGFSLNLLGVERAKAKEIENTFGGFPSVPLSMSTISFDDRLSLYALSQDEGFKVTRITPDADGLDRVDFEFKFVPSLPIATGYFLTDPRRSSLVMKCYAEGPWVGEKRWTTDMRRELFPETSKGGVPRCKSIEYTRESSSPEIRAKRTLKFSKYSDDPVPEVHFRLSHYGLPEPMGVAPLDHGGTRWYIWFGGAAIAAFATAIVFRWLAGRHRAKHTALISPAGKDRRHESP